MFAPVWRETLKGQFRYYLNWFISNLHIEWIKLTLSTVMPSLSARVPDAKLNVCEKNRRIISIVPLSENELSDNKFNNYLEIYKTFIALAVGISFWFCCCWRRLRLRRRRLCGQPVFVVLALAVILLAVTHFACVCTQSVRWQSSETIKWFSCQYFYFICVVWIFLFSWCRNSQGQMLGVATLRKYRTVQSWVLRN